MLQTPIPLRCQGYTLWAWAGGEARAPKSWQLQGSTDGVTFVTLHSVSLTPAWTSGEKKTYSVLGVDGLYRFFKLNVVAAFDTTETQFAELELDFEDLVFPLSFPAILSCLPASLSRGFR